MQDSGYRCSSLTRNSFVVRFSLFVGQDSQDQRWVSGDTRSGEGGGHTGKWGGRVVPMAWICWADAFID